VGGGLIRRHRGLIGAAGCVTGSVIFLRLMRWDACGVSGHG